MGRRVLIVDDDSDSRDALRELLRSWGHEAEVAADGCEGITLALEHRPDVVLLDIRLPDIDGHEVARRIRSDIGNDVHLVALTGSDEDEKVDPFDDYILKPADPDALRLLVERRGSAERLNEA
jgi:CheY-like chemotaxis protein